MSLNPHLSSGSAGSLDIFAHSSHYKYVNFRSVVFLHEEHPADPLLLASAECVLAASGAQQCVWEILIQYTC